MQLEHAIVALWIISSMLACWAFSVAIRLLADRGARRRKRLATKYTRRSLQLAWLLILLCVVGAASSAYFADLITRISGMSTVGVGSLGLTAIGVIFFGCCLAAWAWAGDRPGDQERCPRCWYDMRGSVGLQCPECGHEADEKADLLRTRRPRWAFVLAGVFVALGSGTLVMKDRLNIRSFQSITPTGVMVSQWDRLPESWLYDSRRRGMGSGDTLFERIDDGRVTGTQMQSLAQDVIESMIRSKEDRWDPKHTNLLQSVMYRTIYPNTNRGTAPGPVGPLVTEEQLLQLYTLSTSDIAEMLASGPMLDQTSIRILEANSRVYDNPVIATQIWLTHTWTGSPPTGRWYLGQRWLHEMPEVAKQFQDALSPVLIKFESIDEQTIYTSGEDASKADTLTRLLWQCGLIDDRVELYLRWAAEAPDAYSLALYKAIGLGIALQEPQTRSDLIEGLGAWVERDDPAQRKAALYTIASLGEVIKLQPDARNDGYQRVIAAAVDSCRDDMRPVAYRNTEVSVSFLMRTLLANTDPTGAVIYPLLRDELLGKFPDTTATDRFYYQSSYSNEIIRNWLSAFEDLADHPDPEVRRWVAAHLPERPRGLYEPSMYEDRIDAVIDTLIESSPTDYEVVEYAERVQRSRSSE
ncbi:MAG: hypothetical protein ACF8K1_05270 [Phycisphaerales bacterium JB047]